MAGTGIAVTQATTPQEFADILSDDFLLAPDFTYVFTAWAQSAQVEQEAANDDGFDLTRLQMMQGRLPPTGQPSNLEEAMSGGMGGPLYVDQGLLYPDMFRMIAEAKGPGDTIKINRPKYINGLTTEANRRLGPTSTFFGGTSQAFTEDQVPIAIVEYGGPGDTITGAIAPIAITKFAQHRSKHDLLKETGLQLRRDRWATVDDLCQNRLIAAALGNDLGEQPGSSVTRGGWPQVTTNAQFTGIGNEAFGFDIIVRVTAQMKTRKVPGVAFGAKYVWVLDQFQYQQLELDRIFRLQSVFSPELNPLFPGYKKTVGDAIICESNRMQRIGTISGGVVSGGLGASGNILGYQALVIAPGVLGWASAMAATCITDKNDDGGRVARFAWQAYEGWQVLDSSFVQLVITD